ncbi:MAG: IS200/IS605 family transposase [Candidatus Margulisbacteria bacterium]|nr:IS200/IS605 family transposase [Candidatus Margulisiibacteriota bacterium]MBU1617294.1 IS200/IS605 family transposase [Candidatus Margulisiibacteriota bacterium]
MLYHYTFNSYDGQQTLDDEEIRSFLKNTFATISDEKGFEILACEILCDHVHLLIEQNYVLSASGVMKLIKGISARRLFQAYPTNRFEHRKLWGRSFHARKIKSAEKEIVIQYIKNQRDGQGIDKRMNQKP